MSIFNGTRLAYGPRVFIPTGTPKHIGGTKPLGRVQTYGPARAVTIVVGQNKGRKPENRAGRCARLPQAFSVEAVDRAFVELRTAQSGRAAIAATRVAGKGWYEGSPEKSVAYEIAFIKGAVPEKNFREFRVSMDRLAEGLAERFCQDSVLIIRDDGDRRTAAGATRNLPAKRKARR